MEDKKIQPSKQENEKLVEKKQQELKEVQEEKENLQKPHEKFYKVFRILGNVLFIPFILMIILCSVLMYKSKIRNEVPSLFGYSAVKILSSSMEPRFSKGDVVVVKKIDTNELKVGDIIAFYEYYEEVDENDLNNNAHLYVSMNTKTTIGSFLGAGTTNANQQKAAKNYSRVIFHRIVEISSPTNPSDEYYGKKFFRTQGDSNASPDEKWLMEDYVVGIGDETSKNTFIGKFFQFCTTVVGVIIMVIIPSLALIVIYIIDIIGETRKKRYEEQVEESNEKESEIVDEIVEGNSRARKLDEEQRRQQAILDQVLSDADIDTKSISKSKSKPKAEPKAEKKPVLDTKSQIKPGVKTKTEAMLIKPKTDVKPAISVSSKAPLRLKPEIKSEVKPEVKPVEQKPVEPKAKPEIKVAPSVETKPEPKAKPVIEPKAKPDIKPAEPKVKPESKPKIEPKVKPEPKPKAKPEVKTGPKQKPIDENGKEGFKKKKPV